MKKSEKSVYLVVKLECFRDLNRKFFTVCMRYNICLAVKEIVLQRNFSLKTDLRQILIDL